MTYNFTNGQSRAVDARRTGLVALATDLVTENDFGALRAGPDHWLHTTRIAFGNPFTEETLRATLPQLGKAAALILPGVELGSIMFSCTSATAVLGEQAVSDAFAEGRPGVPVVTPPASVLLGLKKLGLTRLAMLAPYEAPVAHLLADYLAGQGVEIAGLKILGLGDDQAISALTPDEILAAAKPLVQPGAALFIACTATDAARLVPWLEGELGCPVLTSNQAMIWRAMRLAGETGEMPQFGALGAI
ncbi:ectoine utilization protein EutA [Paracoccaceae bacterium GXU_MW_L88]